MSYTNFVNDDDSLLGITSPQSTERLLFNYLRPHLQQQEHDLLCEDTLITQQQEEQQQQQQQQFFTTACWDDSFLSLEEEENNIMIELNNFSDLKVALKDIEELEPYPTSSMRARMHQRKNNNRWSTTEEDLMNMESTSFTVPPSVRVNVESSQMVDLLMHRAIEHWCCIGFKVAPISIDLIQNWRSAPLAIVYCIASISLVTLMDQKNTSSHYSKQAAMVFYEQARHKMDDILYDDMQPMIIQSYFCLSYTSNLLRLYEQQRTWGGLASISLQHLTKQLDSVDPQNKPAVVDDLTLGCWFRWYYIDAWMCLTLNRDCLLPDNVPWMDMEQVKKLSLQRLENDHHHQYSFGTLTHYMRRYIRALHTGKLFANGELQKSPSMLYYQITNELTSWYSQLPEKESIGSLHLHLCYNSTRLVVLYQFLNPQQLPPHAILIDCLETNLELLQALLKLKLIGCDQSTYHYIFFTIHNTAKRIYQYNQASFKAYAQEQLQFNLMLLKSTQAYAHDVFKLKMYAEKIQDQFARLQLISTPLLNATASTTSPFAIHGSSHRRELPSYGVFKQDIRPSIGSSVDQDRYNKKKKQKVIAGQI